MTTPDEPTTPNTHHPEQEPQTYPGQVGLAAPAPAPTPEAPDWTNWPPQTPQTPQQQPYVPIPPNGGYGYGVSEPSRPAGGRGLRYLLLAVALLVIVALSAGIGAVVGSRASSTNNGNGINAVTIGSTSAPNVSDSSLQGTVEKVIKTVQPSVVEITSTGARSEAIGSGNIVTKDGYIVTNDHVVDGYTSYVVTFSDGKTLPATLVGQDPQDDLAVLKVNATNLTPIAFGDSNKLVVGEFTVAVGTPLGLDQSATFGIVSALNRTATEDTSDGGTGATLTGLIQTSAPINPGNSGGALVDMNGLLIGIPTLGATGEDGSSAADGIGFAIPAARVQYVVAQLIQNGKLTSTNQGFLGIQGEDVTARIAQANGLTVQSGVLVGGFANDAAGSSPAQQAGIQTGDVITAVNGHAITSSDDLAGAVVNLAPGTKVSVTVQRGSQQLTITVTLGERPVNS